MKKSLFHISIIILFLSDITCLDPDPSNTSTSVSILLGASPYVLISKPKNSDGTPVVQMKPRRKGCRDDKKLGPGLESVFLTSPHYPHNYRGGHSCVYNFLSPIGTKIIIKCEDFEVPCKWDRMMFSPTGDSTFADAGSPACKPSEIPICAYKESATNRMSIGFTSSVKVPMAKLYKSKVLVELERRFHCIISVKPSRQVPTKSTTFTNYISNDKLSKNNLTTIEDKAPIEHNITEDMSEKFPTTDDTSTTHMSKDSKSSKPLASLSLMLLLSYVSYLFSFY